MKLRLHRTDCGYIIPVWIILLFMLASIVLLLYLFAHLLRIPPRQLPPDIDPNAIPLLIEPGFSFPDTDPPIPIPPGMKVKTIHVLSSTNLIDWEPLIVIPHEDGTLTAPDGSTLTLDFLWDEAQEQTTDLRLILLNPGTEPKRFFKIP